MSESTNSTESKTDSNSGYSEPSTETQTNDENTGGESTTESTTDEFGYESTETETKSDESKSDTTTEETTTDEAEESTEVEKKATGYGEQEESEEEKEGEAEEEKSEDSEQDEKELTEKLTEAIKDLPKGYDKEKVLDFAQKNKLSPDQVKAYVEMEKAANADYKVRQEAAIKEQKKNFINELKNDPTFGGQNFDKNVHNVERVLEKHFPEFKKVLTDRGGMVPPYIMKDLLSLHKTLNPTAPLVNGEPTPPKTEDDGNFLDDLYQ